MAAFALQCPYICHLLCLMTRKENGELICVGRNTTLFLILFAGTAFSSSAAHTIISQYCAFKTRKHE